LKDWHPRLIGLTGTPEQVQFLPRFLLFFLGNRAVHLFAPPMLLLKHDVASQVAQVARTFRVFFSKAKTGDGPEDYLVDHRSLLFFPWHSVLTFSLTYLSHLFFSIIMYLMNPNGVRYLCALAKSSRFCNDVVLNAEFVRLSNDCVQEFVSYYGKNTTAPELAAKILSAVDEFKKL
jgi:hypothetical protein